VFNWGTEQRLLSSEGDEVWALRGAVRKGNFSVVNHLLQLPFSKRNLFEIDGRGVLQRGTTLAMLRYLRERKVPLTTNNFQLASLGTCSLDVVRWACEEEKALSLIRSDIFLYVIFSGTAEVFDYLLEKNAPLFPSLLTKCIARGRYDLLQICIRRGMVPTLTDIPTAFEKLNVETIELLSTVIARDSLKEHLLLLEYPIHIIQTHTWKALMPFDIKPRRSTVTQTVCSSSFFALETLKFLAEECHFDLTVTLDLKNARKDVAMYVLEQRKKQAPTKTKPM
jgi:hypothetical protein